jgi:CelD/BcsL family acetyltransferase involved in cellulose biosynthesis
LQRGWLRLFVLRLDGRPAAALYGMRYFQKFYFYQCGFDPALARHSPGLVTLAHSIRSALAEGADEYDMLHGDEEYKFHWANGARPLADLELYPRSMRGVLFSGLRACNRAGRSMARGLLPQGAAEWIMSRPRQLISRGLNAAEPG